MLVKDIQAVNELDVMINDLIEQLNNLFERRLEIATDFARPHEELFDNTSDFNIDLDSIDLSLT